MMPFSLFLLLLVGAVAVLFTLYHRNRLASARWREAIRISNNGIALLDADGRILSWNIRMEAISGVTEREALRQTFETLPAFGEDHPISRMLSGALNNPQAHSLVFRTQLRREGNRPPLAVLSHVTRFAGETPGQTFILLSVTDIAEAEELRNRLQLALSEAETSVRKLAELDRLKSEFLAICSHELKTPLVSITGYLDLMSSEKLGPLTAKQQHALGISLKNAARLNDLLCSLLDFARMEAGTMRFEFTPQRMGPLIDEVLQVLHPIAAAKQISLVLDTLPPLPQVMVDASLLHRVFLNLLDNAIKFTPPGGEIHLRVREEQGQVLVQIADSGSGIQPEHLGRVKEPFFQSDTSDTRRTGGLGLGLAIVEKILQGHGSQLQLESNPGKGTVARFALKQAPRSGSGRFIAAGSG